MNPPLRHCFDTSMRFGCLLSQDPFAKTMNSTLRSCRLSMCIKQTPPLKNCLAQLNSHPLRTLRERGQSIPSHFPLMFPSPRQCTRPKHSVPFPSQVPFTRRCTRPAALRSSQSCMFVPNIQTLKPPVKFLVRLSSQLESLYFVPFPSQVPFAKTVYPTKASHPFSLSGSLCQDNVPGRQHREAANHVYRH
jgi:hypothetical protein